MSDSYLVHISITEALTAAILVACTVVIRVSHLRLKGTCNIPGHRSFMERRALPESHTEFRRVSLTRLPERVCLKGPSCTPCPIACSAPKCAQPTQPVDFVHPTQSAPLPDYSPVSFPLHPELIAIAVILVSCSVVTPTPGSEASKQAHCRPRHASPATQRHAPDTHLGRALQPPRAQPAGCLARGHVSRA